MCEAKVGMYVPFEESAFEMADLLYQLAIDRLTKEGTIYKPKLMLMGKNDPTACMTATGQTLHIG